MPRKAPQKRVPPAKPPSLEVLFTSHLGFNYDGRIKPTPLQRAICRAAEGIPLGDLWENEEVQAGFSFVKPQPIVPEMMLVCSAIRGGKSTLAAAKIYQCTQSVDLSKVQDGDRVIVHVIAIDKDKASATFKKIVTALKRSPALSKTLIGEPTQDRVLVRNYKTQREIEIKISAVAKWGGTLVSDWIAGLIIDEAFLMAGNDDSKKGLEASLEAVTGRLLPGAQIWMVGSPDAPHGPGYDMVMAHEGKPSSSVICVRAPGPAMNPHHWTPEFCAEVERDKPRAFVKNCLAQFADPTAALIPTVTIQENTRKKQYLEPQIKVPLELGQESKIIHYVAAMDTATRVNAWTLIILGNYGKGGPNDSLNLYKVAYYAQWKGSKEVPLKPNAILKEIAGHCKRYGLDYVYADQYSLDALRDLAELHNLSIYEHAIKKDDKIPMYENILFLLDNKCLELPPDKYIRQDLSMLRKKVAQNSFTIVLPGTADGRHCDYAPSLAICLQHPPSDPFDLRRSETELTDKILEELQQENNRSEYDRALERIMG